MTMKMTTMNKVEEGTGTSPEFFDELKASKLSVSDMFKMQALLQKAMFGFELPTDSVEDFKYSILALVGEMGEVLSADKRWKNIRKDGLKEDEKLTELCDCMAFLVNMILFSGFDAQTFCKAFIKKNERNFERLQAENDK